MKSLLSPILLALASLSTHPADSASFSDWTIFIANDTCPDYTWGNNEAETRKNFAELVRSHLDEMARTDNQPAESRDRYNMAVALEAQCFLERYPERKDELIRRIQEGRVSVSPFLCNTLWAWQSGEGFIRSLYPARRLERDWGIPRIDVAHHIECPSLPWGAPTLLAGCGVRWLNLPFLDYDCTFGQLTNAPVFVHEGPDGSQVRLILDAFASRKANYAQGAHLLSRPEAITNEWLPHYRKLASAYPARAILASGTHSDTHASSAGQTRGFADKIIVYNVGPAPHPKLVNTTFSQFCAAMDETQARTPFLATLRGDFGHSWDLWPVSLARIAADARENERRFLAVESLLAVASLRQPSICESSRAERERAEWCWAMLADHAWNGTDDANRKENARLRREWNDDLRRIALDIEWHCWETLGFARGAEDFTVFNSLSAPRAGLVSFPEFGALSSINGGRQDLPFQTVRQDGLSLTCFVSPPVDGFDFKRFRLRPGVAPHMQTTQLRATTTELESPFYRLVVDAKTGGVGSLVHKATDADLVVGRAGRTLCQTIFFDGQEHTMVNVQSEVAAVGPVLARLRVTGTMAGIGVTNLITVYAELDRIDFDLRISKPVTTKEQRLCQVFPVMPDGATLRIDTPGAVIRPDPHPRGDLLPGADPRRFAVQGFVDVSSPDATGVTIAPLDAFTLRRDLGDVTFEALGNDQNHKEVSKDQGGVTAFRFRYSMRAHTSGYDNASTLVWSRSVASPLLIAPGRLAGRAPAGQVAVDPSRALATCFKPADGDARRGTILRLWEIAERSGPFTVGLEGFRRVVRTDLLERDLGELPIKGGAVEIDLGARAFASLRLVP